MMDDNPYEDNDSGQEIEDHWDWVELVGMVAMGALAFYIVYVWAK
jgi:hypothetical protein